MSFLKPEDKARQEIDSLLIAAGWIIQNPSDMQLSASVGAGLAVREFPLSTGPADYLLFINRQPIGVIEAKKAGETLSGYEAQAQRYSEGLPERFDAPFRPLPFLYQATSNEIRFTNGLDPRPRSRRVFAFHKPETLAQWIEEKRETTRWRFENAYPQVIEQNLWPAQLEAIVSLEKSLANDRPRALIQMATGSGKTYTAVNFVYRMLKHGKVRRVLFLVDRTNLGKQAELEFKAFTTPDDGRKFTEIYNVQRMSSNVLDSDSKVVITTIQRVYSMLRGEAEFDSSLEEASLFEAPPPQNARPREVAYYSNIPIEYFDIIIVDECHRSIYNVWRQVLEYFDAHIIGLTATPSRQTYGFFNENLVMEYTRERAVIDNVNVPGDVYVIRTQITEHGAQIPAQLVVPVRDKKTRQERMQMLDEDFQYTAEELDRKALSKGQIRAVLRTYRDCLFTEIFPGRSHVPKTLIFAKDDAHAEEIVHLAREVFDQGNDFCQKITYKADRDPEQLIQDFRNQYNPRIAVTVDMIATGTDVKSIEVLMFMRMVKSAGLFEQMQGRGVRVMQKADLQGVTPDAEAKTRFVIVDAIGAIETPKIEVTTMERKPNVSFKQLLDDIAFGSLDDDTFITLANRISRLWYKLSDLNKADVRAASGGLSLPDIAHQLLNATDADAAIRATNLEHPGSEQVQAAEKELKYAAADLLTPNLRNLLKEIQARDEMVIDDLSVDTVLQAGFDDNATERARQLVQNFEQFLEQHRDEITALRILYNIPYKRQKLEWAQLTELSQRLEESPLRLTPEKLWEAYAKIEPERVRMGKTKRLLTDIVALVRHALQQEDELIPYPEQVEVRYIAWLAQQKQTGRVFTTLQQEWLDLIAAHIGVNLSMERKDFEDGDFAQRGGLNAATRIFGDGQTLKKLIDELNEALAA